MIRIGLGVSTFNRRKSLEELISSIRTYTNKIPYTLFCSVDGSNDGTVEMLMKEGIEFTYGPNIGPDKNKNRILRRFSQYNYTFIIEDDMFIKKEGWAELYISSTGLFNIPFFIYPKGDKNEYFHERMGDYIMSWLHYFNPGMLFYTRKVIEKVGAIDGRFYGYGKGCLEQYLRMIQAKLVPRHEGYPCIANADEYIGRNRSAGHNIDEKTRKRYNEQDRGLLERLINEVKATKSIYRKL